MCKLMDWSLIMIAILIQEFKLIIATLTPEFEILTMGPCLYYYQGAHRTSSHDSTSHDWKKKKKKKHK